MSRGIWIIADDYGLAPGVNDGILTLIEAGRISGTSCMTVFPAWSDDAARIARFAGGTALGLHLTLTDQPALTGRSSLAPEGKLPPFARLAPASLGNGNRAAIHAELDAQRARFVAALGREPDFVDGHQHVHFLPPVRQWLHDRFGAAESRRPMIRGAPRKTVAIRQAAAKATTIAALALGFDGAMRRRGFTLMGPLAGLYDWRQPACFGEALGRALARLPDGGLLMCHPGRVDAVLEARDPMLEARPAELELLLSERFGTMLEKAGVQIAGLAA